MNGFFFERLASWTRASLQKLPSTPWFTTACTASRGTWRGLELPLTPHAPRGLSSAAQRTLTAQPRQVYICMQFPGATCQHRLAASVGPAGLQPCRRLSTAAPPLYFTTDGARRSQHTAMCALRGLHHGRMRWLVQPGCPYPSRRAGFAVLAARVAKKAAEEAPAKRGSAAKTAKKTAVGAPAKGAAIKTAKKTGVEAPAKGAATKTAEKRGVGRPAKGSATNTAKNTALEAPAKEAPAKGTVAKKTVKKATAKGPAEEAIGSPTREAAERASAGGAAVMASKPRGRPRGRPTGDTHAAMKMAARLIELNAQIPKRRPAGAAQGPLSGTLVLVESPAKAKKIQTYLQGDYKVLATYGHVRDLPSKTSAVDPANGFAMQWSSSPHSQLHLAELLAGAEGVARVILATDPDREGEAIAWHVLQELEARGLLESKSVERITFTSVTKEAVLEAMANPRPVSQPLVDAYLARRALDFLVGFHLSPILWRKIPGAMSAGRVQSVALRMVAEREAAIEAFVPQEYWSVEALLSSPSGHTFKANLVQLDGKKLQKLSLATGTEARAAADRIRAAALQVAAVSSKATQRRPPPPYTTSTLQQDASSRLGYGAGQAMALAQRLYEGSSLEDGEGLITYHRTDGVATSPPAIAKLRDAIAAVFGADKLPGIPNVYKAKAKNAQEAHEPIRPADPARLPTNLPVDVKTQERRLYDLVWRRALASQMVPASINQVGVDIAPYAAGGKPDLVLRATGSTVASPGFLAAYATFRGAPAEEEAASVEGKAGEGDDKDGSGDKDGGDDKDGDVQALAELQEGQAVALASVREVQHFTAPPPRYTEASLVKALEEAGIGRPSTYASTMKLLQDRAYVEKQGKALQATPRGRVLSAFLQHFFSTYVDYDFTSKLEAQLDDVANGKLQWQELLTQFWEAFSAAVAEVDVIKVRDVIDVLDEMLAQQCFPVGKDGTQEEARKCPVCSDGRQGLKLAKHGPFIGCSNFPRCSFSRPMSLDPSQTEAEVEGWKKRDEKRLGVDKETQLPILIKMGPFSPYVQLGENVESKGAKKGKGAGPKRVALPRGRSFDDITLEDALTLLQLPKELGINPETGLPMTLHSGPFGYYLKHGEKKASLPQDANLLDLDQAALIHLISAEHRGRPKSKKEQKPQRDPRNAYVVFMLELHEKALAEGRPKESPKQVGAAWRELTAEEKGAYKERLVKSREQPEEEVDSLLAAEA